LLLDTLLSLPSFLSTQVYEDAVVLDATKSAAEVLAAAVKVSALR
jgi:hypothetical protein